MRILNICCIFLLSVVSSVHVSCNPENPEEKFQLYMQIINFFKGLCCVNTQVKQVGQSRAQGDPHLPPLGPRRALEGSPSRTSPGSHHKGPFFHALWPAPWMVDFSLMHPAQWKTSGKTEERDRGMLFRAGLEVATRSQGRLSTGIPKYCVTHGQLSKWLSCCLVFMRLWGNVCCQHWKDMHFCFQKS